MRSRKRRFYCRLLTVQIAYGIAYSRAPVNMRGVVSAINLFNTGFAYIINLALSATIADPFLIWDFGGPAIVGAVRHRLLRMTPQNLVTRLIPSANSHLVLELPPH